MVEICFYTINAHATLADLSLLFDDILRLFQSLAAICPTWGEVKLTRELNVHGDDASSLRQNVTNEPSRTIDDTTVSDDHIIT